MFFQKLLLDLLADFTVPQNLSVFWPKNCEGDIIEDKLRLKIFHRGGADIAYFDSAQHHALNKVSLGAKLSGGIDLNGHRAVSFLFDLVRSFLRHFGCKRVGRNLQRQFQNLCITVGGSISAGGQTEREEQRGYNYCSAAKDSHSTRYPPFSSWCHPAPPREDGKVAGVTLILNCSAPATLVMDAPNDAGA